jgi:hypothetical protein
MFAFARRTVRKLLSEQAGVQAVVLRSSLHQYGRLVRSQLFVEAERVLPRSGPVRLPRIVLHADIVLLAKSFVKMACSNLGWVVMLSQGF